MKIILVSWSDPSKYSNGISLSFQLHKELLIELGHTVYSVFASDKESSSCINYSDIFNIKAFGNGSLYSRNFFDLDSATRMLYHFDADLVLCESWQNCLTENLIKLCGKLNYPIAVISHGISLKPFSFKWFDIVRSLGWMFYRLNFIKLLRKISFVTYLSNKPNCDRLYDLKLANQLGLKIFKLTNSPINFNPNYVDFTNRKNNVVIIGYYSYVKNQLLALNIAKKFLNTDLKFIFVGPKTGLYYQKCNNFVNNNNLTNVQFVADHDCELPRVISEALLVLSTSITEVLPLLLLEAMACGTPFISSNVGVVSELKGGLVANNFSTFVKMINELSLNQVLWQKLSISGVNDYSDCYTRNVVKNQLSIILDAFSRPT